MGTWLLLKGDQSGVEQKCKGFEEEVRAKARSRGVRLIEADVNSAEDVNLLLQTHAPSDLFFIGHGSGGALSAKNGASIWPTDIVYNPGYLKITFRSVACQLGTLAKDWDLTFGDVYGSTHQMSSAGPFDKPRLHADQEAYQDLVSQVTGIMMQAYSIKMRVFSESAAMTNIRANAVEKRIAAMEAMISGREASLGASNDPGGGYSVGTAVQLQGSLDQARGFLREARSLAE